MRVLWNLTNFMRRDLDRVNRRKYVTTDSGTFYASANCAEIMGIRIVRLGSARAADEGLRIGTVRRPPRGVRKENYAAKDIYDVWFPNLSPSPNLLKEFFPIEEDQKQWRTFKRRFLAEMKKPEAARDLDVLAALSHQTNFSVGCYCENEALCHRSLLRELLQTRGALIL